MATIIHDPNDKYSFNRHTYVNQHWQDDEFISTVNRRAKEFSNSLNHRARAHYESLDSSRRLEFDAEEFIESSRKTLALSKRDLSRYESIFELNTLDQIQRPPICMQPFILSEPTINREFRANRLQGYEQSIRTYNPLWSENYEGIFDSIDDPIFKEVMLGTHVVLESGGYAIVTNSNSGSGDKYEVYKELNDRERTDIRRVWERALSYHEEGNDVTSPSGAKRYNV